MFCWNCGTELPTDAQTCEHCGSPVADAAKLRTSKSKKTQKKEAMSTALPEAPAFNAAGSANMDDMVESIGAEASVSPEEAKAATDSANAKVSDEHSNTESATGSTDSGNTTERADTKTSTSPTGAEAATEHNDTEASANLGDSKAASQASADASGKPVDEDLVLRKNRIVLTGTKLLINGRHYLKKRQHFKEKKGQLTIPLSFVTEVSMFHSRCLGKAVAALLLFAIFAAGAVADAYFSIDYHNTLNTPFYQERIQELEDSLTRLEGSAEADLKELENQLTVLETQLTQTSEELADYEIQRNQERLRRAVSNLSLDYSAILADDFFEKAYNRYIEDLLEAFKNDRLLDSWLYPYYTYSLMQGTNRYISEDKNLDMWFYNAPGERKKFSGGMDDVESLEEAIHDFNLYDRLYYHGRIYITASDFMNTVLYMPNYVADSAVFVKAYGGNPEPSEMSVPGWNAAAYSGFWDGAERYYALSEPVWVDYNLSAENFNLDWNQLVDEQAYYDAYIKFMDTVAPGLSTYNMVSYYGSDDAFGGMGFDITGKEASATEIIALYLQNHPDALEQFDIELDTITTSYDIIITETAAQLEALAAQSETLEKEHEELAAFLEDGDLLRAEYAGLMQEKQNRDRQLTRAFVVFGCVAGFLGLVALICLLTFIHFAKKPRRLLVLKLSDGDTVAFSTAFCAKSKLEELKKRLP